MAHLPIRTTVRENAAWMADEARLHLPEDSCSAKMYDFLKNQYNSGVMWEEARDALHVKYQV